jgi:hypothetical protein
MVFFMTLKARGSLRAGRTSRPGRVFLHIGAPMTGTTYLRSTLARHHRRLTHLGVLYPTSRMGGDGVHLEAVLDVLDLATADRPPALGAWDRLAQSARDWRHGTVVISHELLADADDDQAGRIASSFGGAELHVVYTARDIGRQIPLAWQEWVRNGGTATFPTYVGKLAARDPHRLSRMFWQSHDLEHVLGRWSAFVPPEQVHVVTVPSGASGGDDPEAVLWSRFADVLGLDSRRFPGSGGSSPGLEPLASMEVLRLLNSERTESRMAETSRRVEELLGTTAGAAPAVPIFHAGWLRAETIRMAVAVKEGGYDVVGSLTDLETDADAFTSEDARVTPRPEDVVRAQTRVLAALTHTQRHGVGPAGVRRRALRMVSRVASVRR